MASGTPGGQLLDADAAFGAWAERLEPGVLSAGVALIGLLRLAYTGELAAAHAYRGHARSLADPAQRRRVEEIEREEWRHREHVGRMLAELGAVPSRARERRAAFVGRVLGALCHVTGWLAPMYGAGRLESRNIREYEEAARLARAVGRVEWVEPLLVMAEVEWEHERFFRTCVRSHPLARLVPLWPAPPPKEAIRSRFRLCTPAPCPPPLSWDAARSDPQASFREERLP